MRSREIMPRTHASRSEIDATHRFWTRTETEKPDTDRTDNRTTKRSTTTETETEIRNQRSDPETHENRQTESQTSSVFTIIPSSGRMKHGLCTVRVFPFLTVHDKTQHDETRQDTTRRDKTKTKTKTRRDKTKTRQRQVRFMNSHRREHNKEREVPLI